MKAVSALIHAGGIILQQTEAVAYLRVGLVGPRPHQVRRCPTICGHILGYYTVNHQVPCHIIDVLHTQLQQAA